MKYELSSVYFGSIENFDKLDNIDRLLDKYDLYSLEVEKFGLMKIEENDLEKDSDVLEWCSDILECDEDDSLMILSTSQNGIKKELEKIFSRFKIRRKINLN